MPAAPVNYEARLRRHGRLIELQDAIAALLVSDEPKEPMSRLDDERLLVLYEIELDLPGFARSLEEVAELEAIYLATENSGAAALEALRISTAVGWPCPPRWVMTYLAQALPALESDMSPARVGQAFGLRDSGAGGHGPKSRLDTARRQRDATARLTRVLVDLELVDAPPRWLEALRVQGLATVGDALRGLVDRATMAATWRAALPADLRTRRPGEKRVPHAARIVAYERGDVSAGTLIKWYYEHRPTAVGRYGIRFRSQTP